jgi:hypothetical protein
VRLAGSRHRMKRLQSEQVVVITRCAKDEDGQHTGGNRCAMDGCPV